MRSRPGHAPLDHRPNDVDRSGKLGRGGQGDAKLEEDDLFFGFSGSPDGYPFGDDLPADSQAPQGRLRLVFISERRRSEQALIAIVQESFINGVSTRKIERLTQAMGIENISAGQV